MILHLSKAPFSLQVLLAASSVEFSDTWRAVTHDTQRKTVTQRFIAQETMLKRNDVSDKRDMQNIHFCGSPKARLKTTDLEKTSEITWMLQNNLQSPTDPSLGF